MEASTLSQLADDLLRSLPRDPDSPCYPEGSFRRKLEEANRRESALSPRQTRLGALYLSRVEWADVTEAARLTRAQLQVVRMRLAGMTFEEIGGRRGVSKQGASRVWVQAAKKLARAWLDYPYRGLREAYEADCRRGGLACR